MWPQRRVNAKPLLKRRGARVSSSNAFACEADSLVTFRWSAPLCAALTIVSREGDTSRLSSEGFCSTNKRPCTREVVCCRVAGHCVCSTATLYKFEHMQCDAADSPARSLHKRLYVDSLIVKRILLYFAVQHVGRPGMLKPRVPSTLPVQDSTT